MTIGMLASIIYSYPVYVFVPELFEDAKETLHTSCENINLVLQMPPLVQKLIISTYMSAMSPKLTNLFSKS